MNFTGDEQHIDKESEATLILSDAIQSVYITGLRLGVPPSFVARLLILNAVVNMVAAGTENDLPELIDTALRRAEGG